MNAENLTLALEFVSKSYVELGAQALAKREGLIKSLLSQRRLPKLGWDEATIEIFIRVRCPNLPCIGVRRSCLLALVCSLFDALGGFIGEEMNLGQAETDMFPIIWIHMFPREVEAPTPWDNVLGALPCGRHIVTSLTFGIWQQCAMHCLCSICTDEVVNCCNNLPAILKN
jgi:hypothetical protein